ncbi:MAG: hypothetical protein JO231_21365 [Acidobacteria bacterium]|nr:hypothetical protein [Acidobacteriota bacterium]
MRPTAISQRLVFLIVFLVPSALLAEPRTGRNRYQIHIDHRLNAVSVCRVCTKKADFFEETPLDSSMPLSLHPGDEVEIWMDDPNPLIFTYKIGPVEVFELESVKAAKKFAEALGSAIPDISAGAAASSRATTVRSAGREAATFLQSVNATSREVAARATTKAERDRANKLADSARQAADKIGAGLKAVSALRSESEEAERALESAVDAASKPGLSTAEALTLGGAIQSLRASRDVARQKEKDALDALQATIASLQDEFPGAVTEEVVVSESELDVQLRDHGLERAFFDDLKRRLDALTDHVDDIATFTLQSVDPDNYPKIKDGVAHWELATSLTPIRDQYKRLAEVEKGLAWTDTGAGVDLIRRVSASRNDFENVAQRLESFARLVNAIGRSVPVHAEGTEKILVMDYDALIGRKYPLIITPVDQPDSYSAQISKAIKDSRWQTGTFAFLNEPSHPVRLTVGPAMIYSLLKRKEYFADLETEGANAGKLVIRKKPKDRVTGESVGMMLNLIPRGWDDPFFRPSFQLGINAGKETFGACAGVGFSISEIFSVGIGALVQRQDRLAHGMTVGGVLESADALKLEKEFKAGAYFNLTYHIDVGK